jgi:hypothetical protein
MTYRIMTYPEFIGYKPQLADIDLSSIPKREHFISGYAMDNGPYCTEHHFCSTEQSKIQTKTWTETLNICRFSGEIALFYHGLWFVFPLLKVKLVVAGYKHDFWVENIEAPVEKLSPSPFSIEDRIGKLEKENTFLKTRLGKVEHMLGIRSDCIDYSDEQ